MTATIALVVLGLIAALLLYAAFQPDSFRVQRSIVMQAPPEKIFPHINDFQQWVHWSPWENLDPALQRSYNGAASGTGARYAWQGNNKTGTGSMEIIESLPPGKIAIKLDFIKPYEGHSTTEFTLTGQDGVTVVTWAMFGPSNYMAKMMSIFCSMDKMVGGHFERGLASLKAVAEQESVGK